MKKNSILFALIILFTIHVNAQVVFVKYILTQTGSENKIWNCNYVLNEGKSSFICTIKEKVKENKKKYDPNTKTVKSSSGDYNPAFSRFNVFVNWKDSLIVNRRTNLFDDEPKYYLVKDKLGHFDWQLTDETKEINSFTCQKATCTYRGRDFVAWFTPEIPISAGPWKFNGLPGLILEVADTKNEYQFTAETITIPSEKAAEQIPENDGLYLELEEYVKRRKRYQKEKREETLRKLRAILPRGATINHSVSNNIGIEQKFEFEEVQDESEVEMEE